MKVIVLGADGFIGSHIYDTFSKHNEFEIISVTRKECDLHKKNDVKKTLSALLLDSVLIIASGIPRIKSDKMSAFYKNTKLIENIINVAMISEPSHIVYLSSVEVYGYSKNPISENSTLNPLGNYAIGKIAGEFFLRDWQKKSGKKLTILRLPGVYGPGASKNGFVSALVNSILEKQTFHAVRELGQIRDYLYVEDLAQFITKITNPPWEMNIVNVSPGYPMRLDEIIQTIFDVFGKTKLIFSKNSNNAFDLKFDPKKIKEVVKDFKFHTLRDSLLLWKKICQK